ncbi:unnamed protein product, partial [marine sediment metagenome]
GFPFMKDPDLVLCLPFDEGEGDIAYDKSANGNDGTLVNMGAEDWVDGVIGKALDFDAEDDQVTSNLIYANNPSFTVACWIYPRGHSEYFGPIVGTGYGNSMRSGLGLMSNNKLYYIDHSFVYLIKELILNNWYHVGFTYNNGIIKGYVNGIEVVSFSHTKDVTSATTIIGRAITIVGDTYRAFDGIIDEPRIYKRAITAAEMKLLADSPRNGFRLVAGKDHTYEHAFTDRAIVDFEKVFEDGEEYTEKGSINDVEDTASTFFFNTDTK